MQSTPKMKRLGEIVAEGPASAGTPILAGIFLTSMIPAETKIQDFPSYKSKRPSAIQNWQTVIKDEGKDGVSAKTRELLKPLSGFAIIGMDRAGLVSLTAAGTRIRSGCSIARR